MQGLPEDTKILGSGIAAHIPWDQPAGSKGNLVQGLGKPLEIWKNQPEIRLLAQVP